MECKLNIFREFAQNYFCRHVYHANKYFKCGYKNGTYQEPGIDDMNVFKNFFFFFSRRCPSQARAVAHAVPACALRTQRALGTSRRQRICCGRTSFTVQSAVPPAPVRLRGRGLLFAPPPKKNTEMTPSCRCCPKGFLS